MASAGVKKETSPIFKNQNTADFLNERLMNGRSQNKKKSNAEISVRVSICYVFFHKRDQVLAENVDVDM